jgi:hypothetical protein
MDDAKHCSSRPRIDVSELNYVEVTENGSRLWLHVVDDRGGPASVSLPVSCLNLAVTAVAPVFELSTRPATQLFTKSTVGRWSRAKTGWC